MLACAFIGVLIVGAEPAGCALGLLLHRAGVSVLVAEARDARHKDKLCGGIPYDQAIAVTVENVRAQAAMGEGYTLRACMSIALAAQREAE